MDNIKITLNEDSISPEELSGEYEGTECPPDAFSVEPIAYHLRFTFSDQDKELTNLQDRNYIARCKKIHINLINQMVGLGYFYHSKYISGFETHNKLGEQCKAHLHLVFYSVKNKETMSKKVKRYLSDTYDQAVTGNAAMSFKPQHIRDKNEFWRYPLKQSLNPTLCNGFTPAELDSFHECAKESYRKVVQLNQAKADKSDKSDTLFERLSDNLKKLQITDKVALQIATSKFYIAEDKPLNKQIMIGYVDLYRLKQGLITHEEYWK